MVGLFLEYKESWLKRLFVNLFWLAGVIIVMLWVYVFIVRY